MTPTLTRRIVVGLALLAAGCAAEPSASEPVGTTVPSASSSTTSSSAEQSAMTVPPTTVSTTTVPSTTVSPTTVPARTGVAPPAWLGTRVLELAPGEQVAAAQPTPAELIDRQFFTDDILVPPAGSAFESAVVIPPPADVIARSTWTENCPVGIDELAYVQVSFVGFDGLFHTGELLVRAEFADGIVEVFEGIHALRFPIEEMRVTRLDELDAPPTGDGNNTTAYVCRSAVNATSWSRHAHAGAVDINPFHNPYVKGDVVIPELATAYLDRTDLRPGMITDEVVALFTALGWSWGGNWSSAKDYMHFSDNGR